MKSYQDRGDLLVFLLLAITRGSLGNAIAVCLPRCRLLVFVHYKKMQSTESHSGKLNRIIPNHSMLREMHRSIGPPYDSHWVTRPVDAGFCSVCVVADGREQTRKYF